MKNLMSDKEKEALQEVFESVKKFITVHSEESTGILLRNMHNESQVEQVHTLFYMDLAKDLFKVTGALRGIIECDEETFVRLVTRDGEKTLDEAKHAIMSSILTDMLDLVNS